MERLSFGTIAPGILVFFALFGGFFLLAFFAWFSSSGQKAAGRIIDAEDFNEPFRKFGIEI